MNAVIWQLIWLEKRLGVVVGCRFWISILVVVICFLILFSWETLRMLMTQLSIYKTNTIFSIQEHYTWDQPSNQWHLYLIQGHHGYGYHLMHVQSHNAQEILSIMVNHQLILPLQILKQSLMAKDKWKAML